MTVFGKLPPPPNLKTKFRIHKCFLFEYFVVGAGTHGCGCCLHLGWRAVNLEQIFISFLYKSMKRLCAKIRSHITKKLK